MNGNINFWQVIKWAELRKSQNFDHGTVISTIGLFRPKFGTLVQFVSPCWPLHSTHTASKYWIKQIPLPSSPVPLQPHWGYKCCTFWYRVGTALYFSSLDTQEDTHEQLFSKTLWIKQTPHPLSPSNSTVTNVTDFLSTILNRSQYCTGPQLLCWNTLQYCVIQCNTLQYSGLCCSLFYTALGFDASKHNAHCAAKSTVLQCTMYYNVQCIAM